MYKSELTCKAGAEGLKSRRGRAEAGWVLRVHICDAAQLGGPYGKEKKGRWSWALG